MSLTEQAIANITTNLEQTNRTLESYSKAHHKDMELLRADVTAIKLSLARWGGFCMALIAAGDILLFLFTGSKASGT